MTTDVLAPLTPPETDLQDFPFMPLHVARLRDSDMAAEGDPEGCWYAVLLWAASWHQIPAGSLPDNDAILARFCGLGRDLRTFRKLRRDALRGFIACTDGRLYHPVVAEQAIAAWEKKLEQRWRTECAAVKKRNQRHGTDEPRLDYATWLSRHHPGSVPFLSPGTTDPVPGDNGSKREGQGQGERQGHNDDGDDEDARDAERVVIPLRPLDADLPTELIELTAEVCRIAGLRHVDPDRVMSHQKQVREWLDAGLDPVADIVPGIRQALTDATERIGSLRYFDGPIRQRRARQEAQHDGYAPRTEPRSRYDRPSGPIASRVRFREQHGLVAGNGVDDG